MALVSHCTSVFHAPFTPQMVLANGSLPVLTFVVSGRSLRCMIVPPSMRSLVKLYSACKPNRLLRCMEKVDWFSSFTSTFVPLSMMLWLRMVTVPMV